MRTPQQTLQAIHFLHGLSFRGGKLSVVMSRHGHIAMPKYEEEMRLMQDYSDSPLHRFKVVKRHCCWSRTHPRIRTVAGFKESSAHLCAIPDTAPVAP